MNTTEKSLENQVQLWSMPGPAAILLTLVIITFTSPLKGIAFPLIAIAGFAAAWFWKIPGAAYSLAVLIPFSSLLALSAGSEHPFWVAGSCFSIALAWIVTALSREEVASLLVIPKPEPIIQIQEVVKTEYITEYVTEYKTEYKTEVKTEVRTEFKPDPETEARLLKVLDEYKILEAQRNEHLLKIHLLQNDLINERKETSQTLEAKEAAISKLQAELHKAENGVVWGDAATKEGRALCKVEGMYQQLRDQYEEKSLQLDKTRKDLFILQEQMEVNKLQRQEETLYGENPSEKAIVSYIQRLADANDRLEQENLLLEDLVSKIL